jgi:hypothetical protein
LAKRDWAEVPAVDADIELAWAGGFSSEVALCSVNFSMQKRRSKYNLGKTLIVD